MSRVSAPLDAASSSAIHPITWSWALRRAALGILILSSSVGLVAWLTYTTIEQPTSAPDVAIESGSGQTAAAAF
jgi:uncharacterized MnhB-related membrane protein